VVVVIVPWNFNQSDPGNPAPVLIDAEEYESALTVFGTLVPTAALSSPLAAHEDEVVVPE
jgi:hypothetical protein